MNIEASIMTFCGHQSYSNTVIPFWRSMDLKNATFYKSACHGTMGMTGDVEREFTRNASHRNFPHSCFVGSLICLCTI